MENLTYTETQKQGFPLPPPPLHARKRKAPENCFRSYIDQVADGFYHASKLVRNTPRTNKDIYFTVRTRTTEVRSNRRNYSHRNVSLFRTKKDGSTRANIAYMTCSFLELDGSTDGTIKTRRDVFTLTRENNIPTASYVIETSRGHFHVIWNYSQPLPFTAKGESYWLAQQARLVELFQKGGFFVDKGASLNPCQNLRNPSQLKPYNFKRRCEVIINKTFNKTSLRSLYNALNTTSIPNPRSIPASTKLRQFLRANKTFTMTYREIAENLRTSLITAKRAVKQEIGNGGMSVDQRKGNNKGIKRTTEYISNLYIEPQFSEVSYSSSSTIFTVNRKLLDRFQLIGAEIGQRNRTVFVLAVGLNCGSSGTMTEEQIADLLREGRLRSGLPEREFLRTIRNAIKPAYSNPFSRRKVAEWGLLQGNNVQFQIS